MINRLISELVAYGIDAGLVNLDDKIYTINRLLELFGISRYRDKQHNGA